jgi:MSHA pilin protein MshA
MKNFNFILKDLKRLKNNEAFTLIELVMVILLIGILAAVVMPKFVNLTGAANKAASQGVVGSLGEGVTTQMSKNLVNNDLSTYVTLKRGVPKFLPTLAGVDSSGNNPYANPFLLLPNYTPATSNKTASGTAYGYGLPPVPVVAGTDLSNSWWLDYAPKATTAEGTTTVTSAGLTCDNGDTIGAPLIDIPDNEYVTQIANIDYIYSNGSTEDSYVYYVVTSANNNIEGFYLAPCQS